MGDKANEQSVFFGAIDSVSSVAVNMSLLMLSVAPPDTVVPAPTSSGFDGSTLAASAAAGPDSALPTIFTLNPSLLRSPPLLSLARTSMDGERSPLLSPCC